MLIGIVAGEAFISIGPIASETKPGATPALVIFEIGGKLGGT